MEEKIKNVVRCLATCEHPIQNTAQFRADPALVQWCSVCGAIRCLDGGFAQWSRSACAMTVNDLLVEKALADPVNEEARKAVDALNDD